jgi:hypothetical protein
MPQPYAATVQRIPTTGGYEGQMRETLRRIGQAIRAGSVYPPIRNHAAAVASLAGPKDFVGQLRCLYKDFINRWRYVKDPVSKEMLTASPEAMWRLTMAGDGVGVGFGKGAGDCDCVTAALGAELEAIGFKTRLGTTTGVRARPGKLFGHVFIQAQVPKFGWVTVDPVLHPKKHFGAIADHSRIAFWDLDGNLLGYRGNYTGIGQESEESMLGGTNIEHWQDYGLAGMCGAENEEPEDWSTVGLSGWGYIDTPSGPVSAVQRMGIIPGEALQGIGVEVDENDNWGGGLVRTPMLELSLGDYQFITQNGKPYPGMMALGDTGETYVYEEPPGMLGGFFKKLFRKIRKKVKKVVGRIRGGIRRVLKKSKFGRVLLKVGGAIKKVAMKVVRPLVKFVGKYAGKLAPIAALIPGFGPAIAGGLMVAGKVAKVMSKIGARVRGAAGTVRGLQLKDPRKLPMLKAALTAEAQRMQAFRQQNPQAFHRMATRLAPRR